MFVCLLVCGGIMKIQTLAPILIKFCMHITTCQKVGFGAGLTSAPYPAWAWGT